jgi:hypothetical protein
MSDQGSKNKELDSTIESAAQDRFDEILEKIKAVGGVIGKDEETPLYYDSGREEVEIGERRVVEFNLKGKDFQIIREVKRKRILGVGHKRSSEELTKPIIEMKLKSKSETSDQWVFIDLEDLF